MPGPTVTVIIANSLRYGARAGLLNVAGTQAGLLLMLIVLALGLETVVSQMAHVFFWLKLAGAAYLIWIGIKLWRSGGQIIDPDTVQTSRRNFLFQGFVVILSNPKALLFFGAFIPQFIDPARGSAALQAMIFAGIFMLVATLLDGAYAVLAGGTGKLFTRRRVMLLERISGTCLIGGGLWLALSRRAA